MPRLYDNEVAALTGFPYKEMYVCFAREKNVGCNNAVAIVARWP